MGPCVHGGHFAPMVGAAARKSVSNCVSKAFRHGLRPIGRPPTQFCDRTVIISRPRNQQAKEATMARKRTILIATAAGVALLGAAGAVSAHGKRGFQRHHHAGLERMIERLDADKDGTVTRDETTARRDKSLGQYDGDRNKTLSLKEFEGLWAEHTRERMVRAFQRLDRDGNGQVTAEEFDRPMSRMFSRMDRDGDGKITAEEMRPRRGHDRSGDRGGHR
ncbi:MAG: hypothetical protein GEU92_10465 [Alphaproteobacteria bacterium]|nr:hypothetical protein [Alphaproteobacteria bacterium]